MMAYLPTARTVTVDLAQLSCPLTTAWWFDPRTTTITFITELFKDGTLRQ
jgi:hypothetical protein